jgi:D-glycero-alpha-D-manno-heptose-7-phosphate kinase
MIISKTPVRVSFFGGGTDYPDYYKIYGGSVLSTTIDKYIFITVRKTNAFSEFKYRISYSKLQTCHDISEIEHPVVKAAIQFLEIPYGLEINIISDLPARTGIGSSSSFTVGLLHALYALKGKMVSKKQLAEEAIYVEQVLLQERVGVQDQLAAAYGSLNHMIFREDGLQVNPVIIGRERKQLLQSHLMMFYTGLSRYASVILEEQVKKTQDKVINTELKDIRDMVDEGLQILCNQDRDINEFGALLHKGWMKKKMLSSAISNNFLDEIYEKAMAAGATGGKLLGAGGGGFFVFFVSPDMQDAVRNSLADLNEVDFSFEHEGTSIIHISYS